MPRVEVTRLVQAPIDAVYRICKDSDSYPRFMPNVISITALERGDNWALTAWVTKLQGRTFRWTERDEFDDDACHITYRQISGDLKKFEGEWLLAEENVATSVTLTCEFEFGIPVIAALLNPVATLAIRSNVEGMLDAIQKEAAGASPGDGGRG